MIHETAIIDPAAKLGKNVSVGPYSVIGADVEIGDGTEIGAHVVIEGPTVIGKQNKIFQFASIGAAPQDLKYNGEPTLLKIGDHNTIREFCTFNRGTVQDEGHTTVGNHNLFMAYVHLAHDCVVGHHNVFANNASLAGHVRVGNYIVFGGFSGVFQFCHIGDYSFITTNSVVVKDVPPYVKVSGYSAKPYGLNSVGLKRRGFSEEVISDIKQAYRIIYRKGLKVAEALTELRNMASPEVEPMIDFIEHSKVGIVR